MDFYAYICNVIKTKQVMTKQQFLNGESFRTKQGNLLSNRIGAASYKYTKTADNGYGYIEQEVRGEKTGKVILSDHHLNVSTISNTGFTGYAMVMDSEVEIEYSFTDLVYVGDNKPQQYDTKNTVLEEIKKY